MMMPKPMSTLRERRFRAEIGIRAFCLAFGCWLAVSLLLVVEVLRLTVFKPPMRCYILV